MEKDEVTEAEDTPQPPTQARSDPSTQRVSQAKRAREALLTEAEAQQWMEDQVQQLQPTVLEFGELEEEQPLPPTSPSVGSAPVSSAISAGPGEPEQQQPIRWDLAAKRLVAAMYLRKTNGDWGGKMKMSVVADVFTQVTECLPLTWEPKHLKNWLYQLSINPQKQRALEGQEL